MKNIIAAIIIGILAGAAGMYFFSPSNGTNTHDHINGTTASETGNGEQLYTCGMHPDIITSEPGNCPICGMKLTPVNESKNKGEGVVTISPEVRQNMNVKTTEIGTIDFTAEVRTNGIVKTDERLERVVNARYSGWVEKLHADYTGMSISRGTSLMEIYSPEIVAAQQELITALNYSGSIEASGSAALKRSAQKMVENATRKLELLDLPESFINAVKESGEAKRAISLYAPAGGTVMEKHILEGEQIAAGQPLLRIADLSRLWIIADIYENEIGKVETGTEAQIFLSAFPGEMYSGNVSFIYPDFDTQTRTVKVRIDLPNPGGRFKPDMLATVVIKGKELGVHPAIPEDAVIRTGVRDIAVEALGDGQFKPVEVTLGNYVDGYYQLLSGLEPGDRIVTSAQFLIDSESSLKSAVSTFTGGHQHDAANGKGGNEYDVESPLIHDGEIDLRAIDENNDGKVYECPMDWNVLSDEEGRCPVCEMKMKEYTLGEAATNLFEHGYDHKPLKDSYTPPPERSGSEPEPSNEQPAHSETESHEEHSHDSDSDADNEYGIDSPLIRTGIIDVDALDENGDGKLYECPMDWNIIADEYHRCPVCEMKMKEYTLDDTRANLDKHGYEYKK